MLEKLWELKEKLYRRINGWLYTDKRIVGNLDLATWNTVSPIEDGVKVSYDYVERFTVEEKEIMAMAVVMAEDEIYIAYSAEAIKENLFSLNPLIVWSEIMNLARHEAFHARQYRYIIKRGGMEAVGKMREYMATVDYEDNILEQGAYAYQFLGEEQDFSVFDKYIYPEETKADTEDKQFL